MAIKFSPGPCGCCGPYYAAVAKVLAFVGIGGQDFFTIAQGINSWQAIGTLFFPTTPFGAYTFGPDILANQNLLGDIISGGTATPAIFLPAGSILPIPNLQTSSKGFGGGPLGPVLNLSSGMVTLRSGAISGENSTVQFWLFELEGSKGFWTINSSQTKTVSGNGIISANFTINADGSVGP